MFVVPSSASWRTPLCLFFTAIFPHNLYTFPLTQLLTVAIGCAIIPFTFTTAYVYKLLLNVFLFLIPIKSGLIFEKIVECNLSSSQALASTLVF